MARRPSYPAAGTARRVSRGRGPRRRRRLGAAAAATTAVAEVAAGHPRAERGKLKTGGALRVGATGGGAKDTIDAHLPTVDTDIMRCWNLYESLAVRTPDFSEARDAARRVDRAGASRRSSGTIRLQAGRHVPQRQAGHRRRRDLLAPADHRPEGPEGRRGVDRLHRREEAQEARRPDGARHARVRERGLPGRPRPVLQRDRPDRLRPEEPGRHGAVQVRELHRRPAERVRRSTRTTGRTGSRTSTSW